MKFKPWKVATATFALLAILIAAVAFPLLALSRQDHRDIARNHLTEQRDQTRNCLTGQRAYDALKSTVQTAYKPGSLTVDPTTLPPETQRLLAALKPLLSASAGNGAAREALILKQLGPRPKC